MAFQVVLLGFYECNRMPFGVEHALSLLLHERAYIAETLQIPTPKPYIMLFLKVRGIG